MVDITDHMENRFDVMPVLPLALLFILVSSSLVFGNLFLIKTVSAAEWTMVPRFTLSEMYDDNVHLASEGQEKDDYVTQVNPGFSLAGQGRYSMLQIDYTMQNVFYQYNDKFDDTYHDLRAVNKTEILQKHLYLDAAVNYTQRTLDLQAVSSNDNVAINDNRADVVTYSAKPYFVYDFGRTSQILLQHDYLKTETKADRLNNTDNTTNTSYLQIKSGPTFKRVSWQLSHQKQLVEYDDRPNVKSSNSQAMLNYKLSPKAYIIGVSGYEKYHYAVPPGEDNPEGSYWEAGLGWTPGSRTKLEVRQGEHYYGETKNLLFNHKTRQTIWLVNYSEEINTTSQMEPQFSTEIVDGEEFVTGVSFANVPVVSLNKTLTVSITKNTAKSQFALKVNDRKRKYLEQTGEERSSSAVASWLWRMTGRTSIKVQEEMSKNTLFSSDNETTTQMHKLNLDHKIGADSQAYFSYSNAIQESDASGVLYRRNVYTLGLTVKF